MRSSPFLRNFPSDVCETVPVLVWLTMALSRPFGEDHRAFPFFYASLFQSVDGVMSLALCPPLSPSPSMAWCPWLCARAVLPGRKALNHCDGCLAHRSICSVFELTLFFPVISRTMHQQEFLKVYVEDKFSKINFHMSGLRIQLFALKVLVSKLLTDEQ